MAIKDLFSKQKSQSQEFRGANKKSVDEFRQDVESGEEIKQIRIEDSLVIPDLNYSSASNFVKYGSAKKYYEDAIKRIYSQYPYDGSNKEKVAFSNDLTQLERHILDNQYPKSTGFAVFSPDGWGTSTGESDSDFVQSNTPEFITALGYQKNQIFDTNSKQQQSFRLDFTTGFTVEFWLKKGSSPTGSQAIFDIRDTVNRSASFGAFMLSSALTSNVYVYYNNAVASNDFILTLPTGLGSSNTDWHHYALVFDHADSNYTGNLYIDGQFQSQTTAAKTLVSQTGSLKLTIGALGGDFKNHNTTTPSGYGKLSGSLDEFRFWQEKRNAQQVGRNYFSVVNGGGHTDTAKVNDDNTLKLASYFKFNEGKTGDTNFDVIALDYSGRLTNGAWTGYVANSRDTGSAIVQSSAGTEAGDPIIYSTHPDVVTLSTNLEASGTQYDAENVGSLQDSIPLWMLDENRNEGGELENLLQVMGSYLDSLYLQVTQIPKFHEANYHQNKSVTANPHNNRLLTSLGFDVPELFIDKQVLETIVNQDDKRKFEDRLNEIKNLIYKNIYNNLTYINKSKGTSKSIRNLLRCYGIDDDLFNFNVYADQAQYFLEDDFKNSPVKIDSLDLTPFAKTQNSEGVIYNFTETGNADSSPFISGSTSTELGFTVEANVVFPKTPSTYLDTVNLTSPAVVTASVFGVREAFDTISTAIPTPDDANMTVRVIKEDNTAKFQLSSTINSGFVLESDRFYDVYDNSRWNLSVRIKYNSDEFSDAFTGKNYTVEFNGYNYIQDIQQNSFSLSNAVVNATGALFIASDKRIYAGAERTNITGTLLNRANMKLLSVRAWADYVSDAEIKSHARDVTSFGRSNPYKNSFIFKDNLDLVYIPEFDTLAMDLGFNQVTVSDATGKFTVPDLSSGSISLVNKYAVDNYSKVVNIQNTAQGAGFPASSDVKDIQYLNISKQQIPENLNTDNMIQILENDDDLFFLDNRPVKYFFSLEASMYDTISREMLKTFAGVLGYASIIGTPVVDYQVFNKELRLARQNFFDRVANNPDLEKYVSLYKFLDTAIESVLFNLLPASANSSDRVRTVVESHIFERNSALRPLPPGKNIDPGNKLNGKNFNADSSGINPGVDVGGNFYDPADTGQPKDPVGGAVFDKIDVEAAISVTPGGINVAKPDFSPFKGSKNQAAQQSIDLDLDQFNKKSFSTSTDTEGLNAFYKIRAKRTQADIASSTEGPQFTRNSIHSVLQRSKLLEQATAGSIKGEILSTEIGPDDAATRKSNVILPTIQKENSEALILTKIETPTPNAQISKKFTSYDVAVSSSTGNTQAHELQDLKLRQNNLPIKFTEAQNSEFFDQSSASINNTHIDTYYDVQEPLQGPFTEQHVGGYKHRHVQVGQTSDRPELYKVAKKSDTQVVVFNPRNNSILSSHDFNIPRVKFSREELVKRVYNTKNIKNTVSTAHDSTTRLALGNFDKNYQVVHMNGRKENNFAFVQANGFDVTESLSTAVSGIIDFATPSRALSDGTFNETVIVNRFSSPGEIATLVAGYLDVESGEFSPYSSLPYRNRTQVNNLNSFLKAPSAFGGYQSGSSALDGALATASFHKVQRNRVNVLKQTMPGHLVTSSFEDNGFFNYQIPKKDFGYSWINSSANPNLSMDGLYGFATSSDGITFFDGASRGDDESVFINFAYYSAQKIGTLGFHYELNDEQNLIQAPTAYTDGTKPTSASVYFLNISGPYGYPTFKQTRNAQHPVARFLRSKNFISAKTDGSTRVQHPPVSTKYKPVIHLLKSEEIAGAKTVEKDLILTYPFASEYDYYGDYYDTVNNKLTNVYDKNFKTVDKTDSLFYNISGLYTGKSVLNEVNKISLTSLFYGETIYPKETNAYLSKVRDRSRFTFNWRDSLETRLTTANLIPGTQTDIGTDYKYSVWPMDAFAGSDRFRGELMNVEQQIATFLPSDNPNNVRFGRYKMSGSIKGVNDVTASTPLNTVQSDASQGPFYDSYSVWNGEIRTIAKDHSIVPEYRISDNIANIINDGYDLSNDVYQTLTLTGSQATENNNVFLETYAHSDDIPAIEIVRKIQERDANKISINLSAAKKLLPYDGFYPVQRTLQLSTLFSQSLGPDAKLQGSQASFQTLNNVVFSRLTYGSIRAGVAIDSANWVSGAIINPADPSELQNSSQQGWNRIPFEAILDPASYLSRDSLIIENDHENFFISTASVGYIDPKYALAASNFYAGVVDTFVQNSTLTSIKSAQPSQWTFGGASNYNTYIMDIVISKQRDFTNHDDPGANGYPYFAHAAFYQPLNNGVLNWNDAANVPNSRANDVINPNGSWSSNEATVTINFDYSAFKAAVTDREPTLNDVLFYSTKTYKNKGMVDDGLSAGFGYGDSHVNSSSPFMTIEAGVDIYATSNEGQWSPTLRWECPTHNFVNVTALHPNGAPGGDGSSASGSNRGIWHQFSTDTQSGLKLFARGPEGSTSRTTGSLTEALGFTTEQKVVSQLATSAQLKEFLVVVPFVTNECEEETLFHYPIDQFERAYSNIDKENRGSLSSMLSTQRELILPPKLNYMARRDNAEGRLEQDEYGAVLPPFAMYIFEVSENLNQEDLSKWWQGVLPSVGTKVSMEKFNISHNIAEGEIISPSVLNNDLFNGKLPKEMRFKVFKAKYKRNFLYEQIKNKSINGTEPINSIFGFNYPHDFYSLIEMAKVDLGLEYDGDEE